MWDRERYEGSLASWGMWPGFGNAFLSRSSCAIGIDNQGETVIAWDGVLPANRAIEVRCDSWKSRLIR